MPQPADPAFPAASSPSFSSFLPLAYLFEEFISSVSRTEANAQSSVRGQASFPFFSGAFTVFCDSQAVQSYVV